MPEAPPFSVEVSVAPCSVNGVWYPGAGCLDVDVRYVPCASERFPALGAVVQVRLSAERALHFVVHRVCGYVFVRDGVSCANENAHVLEA